MDLWLQDLRSAIRSLASSRSTALLCVLCLGLGIGVNTMVFSFVNGVVLNPFPFDAPERLVMVNETRQTARLEITPVSYPNFLDLKERGEWLGEIAAARSAGMAVSDGREAAYHSGAAVSWNLFPMLGVAPVLGRGFEPEDDRPGAEPSVLLSDALWQQRFAGDPAVLGRSLLVDGRPHTVIGVMPPHFAFPRGRLLWVPVAASEHGGPRERRRLAVFARLAEGVELGAAAPRVAAIGDDLAREHPEANRGRGLLVRPLAAMFSERTRSMLLLMLGAVGLVLLIACANVANLMLARGITRQREFAIRGALGATRGRIRRQLLTESLILGLASVPLGLLVASLALDGMLLAVPESLRPEATMIRIDWTVLGFTVAVAIATSLLFGLLPSLQAGRWSLRDTLTDGGRESTGGAPQRRLKDGLVVAEVALSVVLLVGAGLFLRSFVSAVEADPGFRLAPLMTLEFNLAGERYAAPEERTRRVEDVVARLQALPGVLSAAASNLEPLRGGGSRATAVAEGRTAPPGESLGPTVLYGGVTADYFETLDVPLLRGRTFGDLEAGTRSAVAVVNQTLAERLWPGEDPIAKRFRLDDDPEATWFQVIGVARDVLTWDISDRPWPTAFLPWAHVPVVTPRAVLRVAGEPTRVTALARDAIHAADPTLPVFSERSMSEVQRLTFWRGRLLTVLFGSFGVFALLLAAVGAYGVLAYWAQRRTREIGVRMALGASRSDVVRLIVRQGMTPVVVGIGLGLLGGVGLTRVLRGRFYELNGLDPLGLAAVLLLLGTVGLISSYWPARRAAGVDPIQALRD